MNIEEQIKKLEKELEQHLFDDEEKANKIHQKIEQLKQKLYFRTKHE